MLPFSCDSVLDDYVTKVWAYETTGYTENHQTKQVKGSDYWFGGVITNVQGNDLQLLAEGEVQSGAITVFVRGPRQLYMTDVQNETALSRQTFVKYQGKIYRIKQEVNLTQMGLYRKYLAVRYVPNIQTQAELTQYNRITSK